MAGAYRTSYPCRKASFPRSTSWKKVMDDFFHRQQPSLAVEQRVDLLFQFGDHHVAVDDLALGVSCSRLRGKRSWMTFSADS
jgi:hypothetical protein